MKRIKIGVKSEVGLNWAALNPERGGNVFFLVSETEKEFCQCKITSDEEALSKAGMSLGGSTYNSLIQCCADVVKTAKDNNCIKHDDQTGDDYVKCKDSLKQFENCTNKFDPGLFEKIMNPGAAFGDCAIIRCRGLIATIFICFLKMWLMNWRKRHLVANKN